MIFLLVLGPLRAYIITHALLLRNHYFLILKIKGKQDGYHQVEKVLLNSTNGSMKHLKKSRLATRRETMDMKIGIKRERRKLKELKNTTLLYGFHYLINLEN